MSPNEPTSTGDPPRVEDAVLLRGGGRFLDDAPVARQAYAHFLRSPHAFAKIRSVDVEAARTAPGVIAVLTASDMAAANVTNVARHVAIDGRGGAKLIIPPRPALAA